MRTLEELVDTNAPGWPLVAKWISDALVPMEVLPVNRLEADQVLLDMQVTTRSPMGAIVHNTGGLLVDDGWLRVLGSGCDYLPRSLSSWNKAALSIADQRLPGTCLFADDVLGGFFALNGGAFDAQPGHVQYLAPDTLNWEGLKMTYSQFLIWAFSGNLTTFYESFRWQGWQEEARTIRGDQSLSIYPPLWAEGPSVAERFHKRVAVEELWGLGADMRNQMMKAQI